MANARNEREAVIFPKREAQCHSPKSVGYGHRSRSVGRRQEFEAGQAAVRTGRAEFGLHESRVVNRRNRRYQYCAGGQTWWGRLRFLTAVSQVSPIKVYFPISEQEYLRMADGGGPGSVDFF